jgi:hypothetical protein
MICKRLSLLSDYKLERKPGAQSLAHGLAIACAALLETLDEHLTMSLDHAACHLARRECGLWPHLAGTRTLEAASVFEPKQCARSLWRHLRMLACARAS